MSKVDSRKSELGFYQPSPPQKGPQRPSLREGFKEPQRPLLCEGSKEHQNQRHTLHCVGGSNDCCSRETPNVTLVCDDAPLSIVGWWQCRTPNETFQMRFLSNSKKFTQFAWLCATTMIQTPHGAGVSEALFVAVMVGNTPNTAVVPLASSILLTNLPLSHSFFQCTSWAGGVSLTALLAYWWKILKMRIVIGRSRTMLHSSTRELMTGRTHRSFCCWNPMNSYLLFRFFWSHSVGVVLCSWWVGQILPYHEMSLSTLSFIASRTFFRSLLKPPFHRIRPFGLPYHLRFASILHGHRESKMVRKSRHMYGKISKNFTNINGVKFNLPDEINTNLYPYEESL